MAAITVDASLAVEATSLDFPFTFPITFGPDGLATVNHYFDASLAATAILFAALRPPAFADAALVTTANMTADTVLSTKMGASLAVTASLGALAGKAYYADASLVATTYPPFPYVFPFVFDRVAIVEAARGRHADTTTEAVASTFASGTRGAMGDADLIATASWYLVANSFGDHPGDASLGVFATVAATLSRGQPMSAALATDVGQSAGVAMDALLSAALTVAFSTETVTGWATRADSALTTTASPHAATSLHALANAARTVVATALGALTRGRYGDASLSAYATGTGLPRQHALVDAGLSVVAITTATTPEPTGFWNFYLR